MTAIHPEPLVAINTPRMLRDAEAMLAVVSWPDAPAGIVVLPINGGRDAAGSCIGSGHTLAVANGCRPGAVAVRVDIDGILAFALRAAPEWPDLALRVVGPIIEQVVLHEVGHAIAAPRDAECALAEAIGFIEAAESRPAGTGAAAHGPAWAAATVILGRRAIRLRPAREQAGRESILRHDVARYGIDAAAVAEAVGTVPDEASVRDLLAPGGAVLARVVAACPPEADRQAFIEHRRQRGAADEVIEFRERKVGA